MCPLETVALPRPVLFANHVPMIATALAATETELQLPDDMSFTDDLLAQALHRDAEIESGLVREISHEDFIAGLRLPKVSRPFPTTSTGRTT